MPPKKTRTEQPQQLGKTAFDKELFADAKKLKAVSDEIYQTDAEVKEMKAEKERLSKSLHDRMLKAGIKSIKLDGLGILTRMNTPFPSIVPGMEAKAFAALRKLGYGALIKETVQWKSLQSLVVELRQKNIKKVEGLEIYDKPVARIYARTGKSED